MNDQAARERIVNDLDTTLFVEAGAGTGPAAAATTKPPDEPTKSQLRIRMLGKVITPL